MDLNRFDEVWDSRIKSMREEVLRAGLGSNVADVLVSSVKAYSVLFMVNAGLMPNHLRDAYAMCALSLLRDVNDIPSDLIVVKTVQDSEKLRDLAIKSRETLEAQLEKAGLLPGEREDLHHHMSGMSMFLLGLMAGMDDRASGIFLKMCCDQLEILVKLHDEATGN